MALLKCSAFGKEISDKAISCPNCGCPVKTENDTETAPQNITCPECKKELSQEGQTSCPHCGFILKKTSSDTPSWKKIILKSLIGGLVGLAVILILIYMFAGGEKAPGGSDDFVISKQTIADMIADDDFVINTQVFADIVCSDDLAKQTIADMIQETLASNNVTIRPLIFDYEFIRAISVDKSRRGYYVCKANVIFKDKNDGFEILKTPITYELTKGEGVTLKFDSPDDVISHFEELLED